MSWNAFKTFFFLSALSGLLLLLGYVIGGVDGIFFAFLISLALNGYTYFYSDQIVLKMYKARPLDPQRYGYVYRMVQQLADQAELPMPKLWLIDEPVANAFATGRNPKNASIAVTSRILEILNEDELRGVLAHELSHVANRDILIGTIAAVVATTISYVANMLYFSSARSRDGERGNPLFVLIAAILVPLAASLIQLAISRSREYMADESGAHICKQPLALATALAKLSQDAKKTSELKDIKHAPTASLFIVNPFSTQGIMALLSTHPPMEERIKKLEQIDADMKRNG